ncbi:MAG TPA: DUF484 family protein [Rhodanobacteraceae bacterium]|nr:DUF484 family protein [Rhodanobacteraceae bacterium]
MPELTLKAGLEAMDVADYLRRHPQFLKDFPDIAQELVIPREHGPASSLTAYQLEALRARNQELSGRLTDLIAIAADNEQLMVRVHSLTISLLRANTLEETCRSFVAALNEDFHTDLVCLALFRDPAELPRAEWLLALPQGKAVLPEFTEFLNRHEPLCGRLAQDKLDRLFGERAPCVQSCALLKVADLGLLAIGSDDINRFHPGIGTIFLKLIAHTLAAALQRFD